MTANVEDRRAGVGDRVRFTVRLRNRRVEGHVVSLSSHGNIARIELLDGSFTSAYVDELERIE